MESIQSFFEYLSRVKILDNTLLNISIFSIIVLVGFFFKRSFSKVLSKVLFRLLTKYKTEISVDTFFKLIYQPIRLFFLLIAGYIAFSFLHFPENWHLVTDKEFGVRMLLNKAYHFSIIASFIWIVIKFIDAFGIIFISKAEKINSKADVQIVPFIIDSFKIIAIILGSIIILGSVFNLDISSLIAGLGIGGLAIALAAQESIANLLGSFTIFLDKPFTVGDLIKTGNTKGVVEKIGFRSTRIRTEEKSYVTIPNKKIIESELDNLSLQTKRLLSEKIILVSDSQPEDIKLFIRDLHDEIDQDNRLSEHRICFEGFSENGLMISIQFYVNSADNDLYLSVKEYYNYFVLQKLIDRKLKAKV